MAITKMYLIWSFEHNQWWKPNSWGYTPLVDHAGRYSKEEAERIVKKANTVSTNEMMIPEDFVDHPFDDLEEFIEIATDILKSSSARTLENLDKTIEILKRMDLKIDDISEILRKNHE